MLTCTSERVNAWRGSWLTELDTNIQTVGHFIGKEASVADVQIQDGIIRIAELDIQDPKAAAVLAEYPQVRWPEITRRALKIGLGYLKGGGKD